ncbi:MAG: hypothetical protein FWD86_02790 [Firmicutes bacterium]|nr:hypothetical protein [Bacillota bacterium]
MKNNGFKIVFALVFMFMIMISAVVMPIIRPSGNGSLRIRDSAVVGGNGYGTSVGVKYYEQVPIAQAEGVRAKKPKRKSGFNFDMRTWGGKRVADNEKNAKSSNEPSEIAQNEIAARD